MVFLTEFDGCGHGGAEQLQNLFDNRYQRDRFFLLLPLAAESQDLSDQIPGAVAGFEDLFQIGIDSLIRCVLNLISSA